MILISTLALLLVLFILSFAFLTSVSGDYFQAGKSRSDLQAFYLAKSGLNYLQTELNKKSKRNIASLRALTEEEMPMSTGTFKLTILDENASPIKIQSTGKAGKYQKTLEAGVDISNGIITRWKIIK